MPDEVVLKYDVNIRTLKHILRSQKPEVLTDRDWAALQLGADVVHTSIGALSKKPDEVYPNTLPTTILRFVTYERRKDPDVTGEGSGERYAPKRD